MPQSDSRPMPRHVIFVICDDLAFGDLSCHGNPHFQTANLDRMHGQSRRLTQYHSGPLCTPARACLMTGRNHLRTGAFSVYLGRAMLHHDEIALPQLLKQAGYHTGLFGKWHLGDVYPSRPMDKGFDEVLWHRGGGISQHGDYPNNRYFDPMLDHNGQMIQTEGYCTDVIFDAAIDWISEHADEPTYTHIAPNCPHTPLQVSESWVQPFREMGLNETHARVYAMIKNIDDAMGRLMQRLDELQIADDTLLVFTSDHGPCRSARHEGQSRFNCGLRDIKGSVYEGGIRVPCFVRWPSQWEQGDDDRLANPMDWLPTLAGPCGYNVPKDRIIDGIDLFADKPDPDRQLFMQWHWGPVPEKYRNFCLIQNGWKITRPEPDAADELYRLPDESADLASQYPDRAATMLQAYEHWFDGLTSERGNQTFAEVPKIVGHDAQPVVDLTWQDWRPYDLSNEGWGSEKPGYWTVQVADQGPYTLDIWMPEIMANGTLTLRCGDWQQSTPLVHMVEYYRFDKVKMPIGQHRLEAIIEHQGQQLGVHRIRVMLDRKAGLA